jgi:hypothetical protein
MLRNWGISECGPPSDADLSHGTLLGRSRILFYSQQNIASSCHIGTDFYKKSSVNGNSFWRMTAIKLSYLAVGILDETVLTDNVGEM